MREFQKDTEGADGDDWKLESAVHQDTVREKANIDNRTLEYVAKIQDEYVRQGAPVLPCPLRSTVDAHTKKVVEITGHWDKNWEIGILFVKANNPGL